MRISPFLGPCLRAAQIAWDRVSGLHPVRNRDVPVTSSSCEYGVAK